MAEPRARVRTKGATLHPQDLQELLYGFGDARTSLPLTLSTLDEILTDFIIETCHAAALSASYSRRQKIKADDFKFVLRKDEMLLGRVLEQLWKDKRIKTERRFLDVQKEGVEDLGFVAEAGGVGEEMKRKKGRRGRKRRAEDDGGGRASTKRKTE